ncbi:hypothetical protein BDN72DRAFT_933052 [Pluteus cervinus]|uniref:Uncharacterized protein n=1 Tax=Pluteus cervinus TaxID=181527 RepID=A0ACD3A9X0_9AGAR|nr:hypothetical protein BDN72DRAFT_933052 [Pluteus cervinus]
MPHFITKTVPLPEDLERHILERFYQWIKNVVISSSNRVMSFLHKTVVNHPSRRFPPNAPSLTEIYGRHTRNLLIEYHPTLTQDGVLALFKSYPMVEQLALWGDDPCDSTLYILLLEHVTHLSIHIEHLTYMDLQVSTFYEKFATGDPGTFVQFKALQRAVAAFFSRVTHLEIVGHISVSGLVNDLELLRHFTSLSHLCVPQSLDWVNKAIANHAVKTWPLLEVFALLAPPSENVEADGMVDVPFNLADDLLHAFDDETLEEMYRDTDGQAPDGIQPGEAMMENAVVIPCSNLSPIAAWEKGMRDGDDIWVKADRIINNIYDFPMFLGYYYQEDIYGIYSFYTPFIPST